MDARGVDLASVIAALPRTRKGRYAGPPVRLVDLSFAATRKRVLGTFGGVTFEDCVLDGLVVDVLVGTFVECTLRGLTAVDVTANVDRCDLSGARVSGSIASGRETNWCFANLSGSTLTNRHFVGCRFDHAAFTRAELGGARFEACSFDGASFADTFYAKTRFTRCTGLDATRMVETSRAAFGRALSASDDVVIEP